MWKQLPQPKCQLALPCSSVFLVAYRRLGTRAVAAAQRRDVRCVIFKPADRMCAAPGRGCRG